MSLIELRNIIQDFDISDPWMARVLQGKERRLLRAVDDVSLSIEKGETYALVGESGSGKSTIAKIMVGLLNPTAGQVVIDGQPLTVQSRSPQARALRRRLQMVFQSPYASLNPRWRVGSLIGEPISAFGLLDDKKAHERRVHELLEMVGLSSNDANRFPHEFSGGQRQRICIARVLASEPEIIVCDEPTSALDVSVQAQVLNLLRDLQSELDLSYLFITHDLAVVRQIAHRAGVLYLGQLVEEQSIDDLFATPQHPYTQMLLEAAPRVDRFNRDFTTDPDAAESPSPINRPSGCPYHTRCERAVAACQTVEPSAHSVASGFHRCDVQQTA